MSSPTSSGAAREDHRRGLTVVYTGDGKGKTTAALGMVFRALGRGFRVAVVQFVGKPRSGPRVAGSVQRAVTTFPRV